VSYLSLLVVATNVAVVAVGIMIVAALRRKRFQFSLRSLLIVCTLLAVILSAIYTWRHWTTAQTTRLDPSSPEARQFLARAEVVETPNGFAAAFRPNFRNFGELVAILEKAAIPPGSRLNARFDHQTQQMQFEAAERKPLEDRLTLLKSSDVLQPGWFVIRGRVEDSAGDPVGGAIVDLFGSYCYINHFQTRPDGTFVMPIQPPAGGVYYLRVRYNGDKQEMSTESFRLDLASPEKVVRIRVN